MGKRKQFILITTLVIIVFTIGFLVAKNTLALGNTEIYTRDQLSEIIGSQKDGIISTSDLFNTNLNKITLYLNNERVTSLDLSKDYDIVSYDCSNDGEIFWDRISKKFEFRFLENSICSVYMQEITIFTYDDNVPFNTYIVPTSGTYRIELWGAQGGGTFVSGYGAYTKGEIALQKNDKLYFYIGEYWGHYMKNTYHEPMYNGGGVVEVTYFDNTYCCGGGDATDVRLTSGVWNNAASLRSRIMVAGGGGGRSAEAIDRELQDTRAGYAGTVTAGRGEEGCYPGYCDNTALSDMEQHNFHQEL